MPRRLSHRLAYHALMVLVGAGLETVLRKLLTADMEVLAAREPGLGSGWGNWLDKAAGCTASAPALEYLRGTKTDPKSTSSKHTCSVQWSATVRRHSTDFLFFSVPASCRRRSARYCSCYLGLQWRQVPQRTLPDPTRPATVHVVRCKVLRAGEVLRPGVTLACSPPDTTVAAAASE
jgi:hypothetical protein